MANAKIDASQVDAFARNLNQAAQLIEKEGDQFEEVWGDKLVDVLRVTVPVDTGRGRDSIEQGEPGEIAMEGYLRFVDRGTALMSPQPFIRPAMKRIENPAREDAAKRAVKLIQRGR